MCDQVFLHHIYGDRNQVLNIRETAPHLGVFSKSSFTVGDTVSYIARSSPVLANLPPSVYGGIGVIQGELTGHRPGLAIVCLAANRAC